jgi:lipopolysaccharide export system permease protein
LFILIDFIERSRHLFKHGANFGAIFLYYLFKSPNILFLMLPVAVLLGTLLTLTVLSKHSEIVAIKAGGIPVIRAVLPILVMAGLISGGGFLINETLAPASNLKAEYIYKTAIKKQTWKVKYKKRNVWYKAKNAIYKFDLFVPEQGKMDGIAVYRFDDQFHLIERIEAEKAQYYNDRWHMLNGVRRVLIKGQPAASTGFEEMTVDIPETPADLKVYQKKTEQMNYRELKQYVARLEQEGYDATMYRVDMHAKLSFPLVSIIMAILGIPFAIRHGRQGGMAAGFGIGVVLGVVYWIALSIMLALGHSGALGPIVSAWGSHALFGIIGIVMLVRMEK